MRRGSGAACDSAQREGSSGGGGGIDMRPDTAPEPLERFGLPIGDRLAGGWTPPA
jgi:hypothetical protein